MIPYGGIDFDEGWETILRAIQKLISFVDSNGVNHDGITELFSLTESMSITDLVFNLCLRNKGGSREKLYRRYQAIFQQYINTKVLPAMRVKNGELMLREVVKRWREYKFIVQCIAPFFLHLDQYFTRIRDDRRVYNTALLILQNLAYEEMKGQIIITVLSMIDADRDGHSVDRAFVKEVLETVYDLQSESTLSAAYQTDFELALLDSSSDYYLIKKANWYQNLPFPEYMSKVVECMNAEKSRAMQYLHPSTVQKLLERIKSINPKLDRIDGNNLASKVLSEVQQLKLGSNII